MRKFIVSEYTSCTLYVRRIMFHHGSFHSVFFLLFTLYVFSEKKEKNRSWACLTFVHSIVYIRTHTVNIRKHKIIRCRLVPHLQYMYVKF